MALNKDQFAEALKHHRQLLGLNQIDVAGQVGVDLRTYQRWEAGERMPYNRHIVALARVLDVDTETFTGTLQTSDVLLRIENGVQANNRLARQLLALAPTAESIQTALEEAVIERQAIMRLLERIETLVASLGIPEGATLQDHLAQIARETSAEVRAQQAARGRARRHEDAKRS